MGEWEKSFDAEIISSNDMDACYVCVPIDIYKEFGVKRLKVHATFDGYPYDGLVLKMGTPQYIIGIRKDIRSKIGKQKGDTVRVTLSLQ